MSISRAERSTNVYNRLHEVHPRYYKCQLDGDATGNVTGITEDIEVDDLCIMTP